MKLLAPGIYESLIDEFLRDTIARHPELRTVFGKIDPEDQPVMYAAYAAKVLEQAFREEPDPERRLALCKMKAVCSPALPRNPNWPMNCLLK